ncbi:MAG: hypothetical protein LBU65_02250 [Planctomycetaceae bacterium]|nr:hypothetical protein [Planctomycetaceae bacterium]
MRELASLNLINIVSKRKRVVDVPKEENRKTADIEIADIFRRMDEYQSNNGLPQLSEEELVAGIDADIKEYRREKYASEGYIQSNRGREHLDTVNPLGVFPFPLFVFVSTTVYPTCIATKICDCD